MRGSRWSRLIKTKKWILLVAAAVLAIGVWFFPPWFYRSACELDIQEALVRHLLDDWPAASINLEVDGGSASAALIERLKDLHKDFRESISGPTEEFIDPYTGKRFLVCSVGRIRWRNLATVEVEGMTSTGLMGSSGAIFILRRNPGGWSVVDKYHEWVS